MKMSVIPYEFRGLYKGDGWRNQAIEWSEENSEGLKYLKYEVFCDDAIDEGKLYTPGYFSNCIITALSDRKLFLLEDNEYDFVLLIGSWESDEHHIVLKCWGGRMETRKESKLRKQLEKTDD